MSGMPVRISAALVRRVSTDCNNLFHNGNWSSRREFPLRQIVSLEQFLRQLGGRSLSSVLYRYQLSVAGVLFFPLTVCNSWEGQKESWPMTLR